MDNIAENKNGICHGFDEQKRTRNLQKHMNNDTLASIPRRVMSRGGMYSRNTSTQAICRNWHGRVLNRSCSACMVHVIAAKSINKTVFISIIAPRARILARVG